jgi:hypothetical protein
MTSQLDIYQSASVLLQQHGDEALSIATKRMRQQRANGDEECL